MYIFKKNKDLQAYIRSQRENGKSVGFVPTMGALHAGHLSLIDYSSKECDITVCSIFVNPTQFNDKKDLEKYPRSLENDIAMLGETLCTVLYAPSVEEIYPEDLDTNVNIDLGLMDKVMEGKFRPGHFAGMMQVVKRLLDIVMPDNLYMGQKDYQQQAIVGQMIEKLEIPVHLVTCPTSREADGLAMSSRNVRLSPEARRLAPMINHALEEAKQNAASMSIADVKKHALNTLNLQEFNLEYFEIVDGTTLQTIKDWNDATLIVACVALQLGDVRLIDNMIIKKDETEIDLQKEY